jgi:hypothetical protein
MAIEICDRKLPNTYKYKYEWMQKNANEVETLILGNSHTYYGIQPKYLKGNAFNLANPSQLLEQDLFLLKYWSDKYVKLKTVILPISYFTLFAKGLEFGGASYRCRYYRIYMDCDLYPSYSFSYNFEIAESKTALFKLRKFIFGTNEEVDWFCDEYGNEAFNCISNKEVEWNKNDQRDAASAKTWEYTQKNYRILEDMIKFCIDRDINLVLITTPCWHTYCSFLEDSQLKKMHSIIHELQQKYEFPYFDYLQDKRFTADDFFNGSHLSELGELKFTKILDEDIRSIER